MFQFEFFWDLHLTFFPYVCFYLFDVLEGGEKKSKAMGIHLSLLPLVVMMRVGNKRKSISLRRGVSVAFPLFLPMPVSKMLWPLKYLIVSGAM